MRALVRVSEPSDYHWTRLLPAFSGGGLDDVRQEVERGDAFVYRLRRTWLVLRYEARDMVVVAASGTGLHLYRDAIIKHALDKGYASIRWHTLHPSRLVKATRGLKVSHWLEQGYHVYRAYFFKVEQNEQRIAKAA